MPSLSLCMIARNEEAHLPRCLASVRTLVDEIVLVDTGSTDRTVEIARSFGARVLHFEWQDDFSLARNVALDQATGDWILSLDADEVIAARDHAPIRAVLDRADVDAVLVAQRHYLAQTAVGWQAGSGGYDEGAPYSGFVDVDCRRLFRNAPWLRFRNRVHEDLLSNDPARPIAQVRGSWVIHHFGKVGGADILRAKGEAYLRIGARKIEEQPDDPQAHYELGIQYSELGRPADALAVFERLHDLKPGYRDVSLHIGLCHLHQGRPAEALRWLSRAARDLPRLSAEIALEQGNAHQALGDARRAETSFSRAIELKPAFAAASVNLALLQHRAGRSAEALACLDRAIALGPSHVDLRLLRSRIRRDLGDDLAALQDLEHLGALDVARRLRARLLTRLGRFAEAQACIASVDGGDAEIEALRGAIALGLGDLGAAAAALQRSVALESTLDAERNLATVLQARGDRDGALAAAARAVGLREDDATRQWFAHMIGDTLRRSTGTASDAALRIYFLQKDGPAYHGRTPVERALGGTESAIVHLAASLARLGHRVSVFNNVDEPGVYDNVEYGRVETLPARALEDRPDVIVAVRWWRLIGQARLAPLQIFWTGDAHDQPYVVGIGDEPASREIDFVMLQSDWQSETFQSRLGVDPLRILRTRLGPSASAAPARRLPQSGRRPRRLAYASAPYRGLDTLLSIFPRIRAACPDAELEVYSSMAPSDVPAAEDRRMFERIRLAADQPGVRVIGSVRPAVLAARLEEARVLAYPNHFAETFCVAAIEAQAAGCVVVTSRLGALPETVGEGGVCIDGEPSSEAYRQAFVDACVALLTDDEAWEAASTRAIARAWKGYAWPAIAADWDRMLRAALAPEPPVLERVAVHLGAGRAWLAGRMLERETRTATVPEHVWVAVRALAAGQDPLGEAEDRAAALRDLVLFCPSLRRHGVLAEAAAHHECSVPSILRLTGR